MLPPVVARIAYGVYAVILLITRTLLLTAPGRRVAIYAALGVIASIPTLCDNLRLRLLAVPAIVLVMGITPTPRRRNNECAAHAFLLWPSFRFCFAPALPR
jgi:hypothetical protein